MLQLESIDDAYSFHSYDEHSIKLIKPKDNIHANHSNDNDLIEITTTTMIYKDLIESNNLPVSFNEFNEQCIEKLLEYDADIFLIGTGTSSRFPDKSILQYIADNKLSIDFMDIGAASRTFNILTSEYRKVAVLIFFN
ncbi:MAG: hypothetical protein KZQ64_10110 [gamma proteobacterium symbiont of Bathyaustriella thionipta]|nr:hypothetical protein [gamma proteobacterium symbiont of Bathyaustriella thionipta]MCU7950355.1 hypothetical protein [gamma proteobacterium symbiont of Bathyaustriella thionipta]MCU7953724.1 hypothetical protein [gamma proteobacterium symbiont of Bathyaustriella thionipta]MCU7957013.1 hypothetical protein [gamma proteobacterium symbiont of Bathyaustriella thionipta]MCU7967979.1 hypothetical protein [gamma proteobacterium symbiont of Bathyaustriella thionipta]